MESKSEENLSEMRMEEVKKQAEVSPSVMGSQLNSINLTENENDAPFFARFLAKIKKLKLFYTLILALVSTISITSSIFLVKLSTELNPSEMATIKFGVQITFCFPFAYFYKQNLLGAKDSRLFLVGRGLIGALSILACYFSIRYINFSDSITIRFSSPILVAVIARLILKEKFSVINFVSLCLSVLGLLCMTRPVFIFGADYGQVWSGNDALIIGTALALFSALFTSSNFVFIKKLTNNSIHFSVIVFYYCVIGFCLSAGISAVLFACGVSHQNWSLTRQFLFKDVGLAVLAGMINFLGHVCFTWIIERETASRIALLRTFDILVAFLLEFVVLKLVPNWLSLIGASLILAGVLVTFVYHFIRLKRKKTQLEAENYIFRI